MLCGPGILLTTGFITSWNGEQVWHENTGLSLLWLRVRTPYGSIWDLMKACPDMNFVIHCDLMTMGIQDHFNEFMRLSSFYNLRCFINIILEINDREKWYPLDQDTFV